MKYAHIFVYFIGSFIKKQTEQQLKLCFDDFQEKQEEDEKIEKKNKLIIKAFFMRFVSKK